MKNEKFTFPPENVDLGALDTTVNKLLLSVAFIGVGVYLIKPYRTTVGRTELYFILQ